jgi:hypothetical protein
MIYRSAELETCSPTNSIGVRTEMPYLANVLGIKLDIDLRKTNEVLDTYLDYSLYYSAWKDLEISNISPDITRYSAHLNAQSSFPSYATAIIPNSTKTEQKRANIWKVFEQFTIEDNYPIIFHCAHGKDRAGTVGYILLSVLGVPADNAKRDFGLSWLYYVDEPMIEGFGYTPIDAAVLNFPSYGGDTLKEQCENYLVVCARDDGVSETVAREKIAKFRSLMLEEPEVQIASSDSETVTYTWTGNGGDNNWTNPANWASPEDSYGYPNAENAVVYINDENCENLLNVFEHGMRVEELVELPIEYLKDIDKFVENNFNFNEGLIFVCELSKNIEEDNLLINNCSICSAKRISTGTWFNNPENIIFIRNGEIENKEQLNRWINYNRKKFAQYAYSKILLNIKLRRDYGSNYIDEQVNLNEYNGDVKTLKK